MPFIDMSKIDQREVVPGYRGRFVHSESMTAVYWDADAGAPIPQHAHPHEQIMNLVAGEFELTVGGEMQLMTPGMIAVIPPDVPHSGRAVSACRIIDVFHPIREDYR
ncbi:MAG: cupin domain-containing protein [Candidatus Eisenbacteria bacterium]|nr:cupin domain-containing protein [Candidatus Eisenbacteria bacterium]